MLCYQEFVLNAFLCTLLHEKPRMSARDRTYQDTAALRVGSHYPCDVSVQYRKTDGCVLRFFGFSSIFPVKAEAG